MEKKKIFIIGLAILLLMGICIVIYNHFKPTEVSDAIKFQEDYPKVSKDNVFVYRSENEIIQILEHGTGVIYLGFPQCPWCQEYVTFVDEVAKETGLEKIYYLNIFDIRQNNTQSYQKLVALLDEYLSYDDEGNKRIYVPTIISIKDGKITGFDDETSKDTKGYENPQEYWENEDLTSLKNKLKNMFQSTIKNVCTTDCNK